MSTVRIWDVGQPSLEEVLRADPALRARAKAIGAFTETIARIEADEKAEEDE